MCLPLCFAKKESLMKDYLECGKIVSTHGVHGEVKAEVWMDAPEEMTALKTL